MGRIIFIIFMVPLLSLNGCATTGNKSTAEKRQAVQNMRSDVLSDLYKIRPDVKSQISGAPGYAVFSNANVNLIFASFGGGYCVLKDNHNGHNTYMNMGEVGIGLGLGVKDFRGVFIFHNAEAMKRFRDKGWAFGAQADAAAKASDKGGAVGGKISVDNMTISQLTEAGLALQATIKGTKFWKDNELN